MPLPASKRFLEDGRGFTAGDGGVRQKNYVPPLGEEGGITKFRVPLLRSESALIHGYTYEVSSHFHTAAAW